MRHALVLTLAAALSGCGIRPVNAELYALVVDFFRPPASCYSDGMQPTTGLMGDQPAVIKVQVWDGPEGKAFLEVVDGALAADMGDAPSVDFDGVFSGTKESTGWVFSAQRSSVANVGGTTVTSSTSATVTFWRDATFKGTAALSSLRTCTAACPGMAPSCTVSDIPVSGTRLAVDWEQAP
ncbi:MAG: hypothetical protein AB1938_16550 [Myxococcota bacterium]